MKIKEQLPPLIRGNSRQAGVTKAEQEKPLTANHCIDPQASPLTTSHSTAPPPLPCPQTCLYTAVHRPLRTHTCTHAHGQGALSSYPPGGRPSGHVPFCRFCYVDCAILSFCAVRVAPWTPPPPMEVS